MWEEVEARTSEQVELSGVFLAFMVLAGLLAAVGIYQDSAILIVGAMVVGPEFGPLAGFCVALVQRAAASSRCARALALAVGFPLAIAAVYLTTLLFKATGIFADDFSLEDHSLANIIAQPDFFTFFVAACAGAAGMLSLSTAKSGALIGVLISRHDDPRGREHRRRRRLPGLGRLAREHGAARDQPRRDRRRRHRRPRRPARALPPAQGEAPRRPGAPAPPACATPTSRATTRSRSSS